MHWTILASASDDFHRSFKNLKKCVILKVRKKSTISKTGSILCFSKSARPDCNHLHFKSIKNALKIIFSQKTVDFCIFNPKNYGVKNSCTKTLLNFYPFKCTYLGKSSFQFYKHLVRKIEFEK